MKKLIETLSVACAMLAFLTSVQAQIVIPSTTTTLSRSPVTSVYGQQVTFTAVVSSTSSAPIGRVNFNITAGLFIYYEQVALTSSSSTSSVAVYNTSTLSAGSHQIYAAYSPTYLFTFSPSTSSTITHTVGKANTSVSVSCYLSDDQKTLSLLARVAVAAPGGGNPTGAVDFYLDGNATPLGSGSLSSDGWARFEFSPSTPFTLGNHTVTVKYNGNSNYNASPMSTIENFYVYDITPKFANTATIQKTYGDPPFVLPAVSGGFRAQKLVIMYSYRSDNEAVASVIDSTGQIRVTVAGAGEANIYVKQLANSGNGDIIETPESVPLKIVVSRKPVTVAGITATKVYDGTNAFTNAQINITGAVINGRVGSDVLSISKEEVSGGTYGPGVGTGTLTVSGGFMLTGADAWKYILTQPTVTATITAAPGIPVSVTALGGSSIYGESPANPGLSATGLTGGDTESALTGLSNSFGIVATTPAGVYTLTVAGTLTNSKYNVSSRNTGEWIVNKRPVTIRANDITIIEGETPVLDYTITSGSLVNGDALTGELRCDPPYTLGTHPITQGTLAAGSNYDVTFVPGTLNVINNVVLVSNILVEGLPAERNGNSFSIASPCGAGSVDVRVNTDWPAMVRINGVQQNPQRVNLPNYGDNIFTVTVNATDEYTLTVHRSVPVEVAFYDRFRDVLTVPVQVEGIAGAVSSVEWYHNGVRLDRDPAKGYLEMTEPGAYHALLNGRFRTCEVIKSDTRSASTMTVYPNPAAACQEVTININCAESELQGARLQMHGLDGRLLKTLPVSGVNFKAALPDYSGVIVVKLIYANGNEEVKLIVR